MIRDSNVTEIAAMDLNADMIKLRTDYEKLYSQGNKNGNVLLQKSDQNQSQTELSSMMKHEVEL